ncbi:MAG: hypothetical protein PVF37_11500 [Desulfobacterales bacterium]
MSIKHRYGLAGVKKSAADFADCLLAQSNLGNGCEHTVTLDKKASASVGYQLLA